MPSALTAGLDKINAVAAEGALDAAGEIRPIGLSDIYDLAAELGDTVTPRSTRRPPMPTSIDPAAQQSPTLPQVDVYHGADGVPVVDIDTAAAGADGHDGGRVPYLHVVVNDDYVHEHNPPQPLPGSRDALDLDCETGPNDEHHRTLREGDAEDALQIAACIGMEPLVDPGRYPHLEQRGLIRVQITPGAHKHASATPAGDEILKRALPNLGRPHPEV